MVFRKQKLKKGQNFDEHWCLNEYLILNGIQTEIKKPEQTLRPARVMNAKYLDNFIY